MAYLPSRGVHHGSGLDRRPTSSASATGRCTVLARAGWWRSRPTHSSSGCRRRPSGRRRSRSSAGERAGLRRSWSQELAGAGYERADTVEERGELLGPGRADRRLPDDRARADPDRVLRRRGGAPVGVLGVHAAVAARPRARSMYPAAELQRRGRSRCWGAEDGGARDPGRPGARSARSWPAARRGGVESRALVAAAVDEVAAEAADRLRDPDVRARGYVRAERGATADRGGARRWRRCRWASRVSSRPSRRRWRRSGSPRPRTSCAHWCAPASACWSRSRIAARPSARALAADAASRRSCPHAGDGGPVGARRAPSCQSAAAARRSSPRLCGWRCCPSAQLFRRVAPAAPAPHRPGARGVHRSARRRLRRPRGPRRRPLRPLRHQGGGGVDRDYLYLEFKRRRQPVRARTSSSARSAATSARTAARPALSQARRQGWHTLKARARARRARAGRRAARAVRRAARRRPRRRSKPTTSGWRGSRTASRSRRPTTRQRAIDAVKEDLESRPADGPAGLRRRRLRQDRGGAAGGVQGRRPAAARC